MLSGESDCDLISSSSSMEDGSQVRGRRERKLGFFEEERFERKEKGKGKRSCWIAVKGDLLTVKVRVRDGKGNGGKTCGRRDKVC